MKRLAIVALLASCGSLEPAARAQTPPPAAPVAEVCHCADDLAAAKAAREAPPPAPRRTPALPLIALLPGILGALQVANLLRSLLHRPT